MHHLANDITNQKFGRLIAIQPIYKNSNGHIVWLCICDCGEYSEVRASILLNGTTKACSNHRKLNLVGQQFGELTVIKQFGSDSRGNVIWECLCSCGRIKNIIGFSLTMGKTTACGHNNLGNNKEHFDNKAEEHVGEKKNRLEIIAVLDKDKSGNYKYAAICDCGEITEFQYGHFKSGNVKSCGCLLEEYNASCKGKNHSRWNKDRNYIKAAKIYRSFFGKKYYLATKYPGSQVLEKYFGYSLIQFKAHIESKFESGMTWQNYGKIWEIDHIYPISGFLALGITDHKIISALINLRPMFKSLNRIKHNKIVSDSMRVLQELNKNFGGEFNSQNAEAQEISQEIGKEYNNV